MQVNIQPPSTQLVTQTKIFCLFCFFFGKRGGVVLGEKTTVTSLMQGQVFK